MHVGWELSHRGGRSHRDGLTSRVILCSSHMDVSDDDPNVGAKFSVETLRHGHEGLDSIPSTVHGAPVSAQVSFVAGKLMLCCRGVGGEAKKHPEVARKHNAWHHYAKGHLVFAGGSRNACSPQAYGRI